MTNILISGDPMEPSSTDMIHQTASLKVGEPVPEGWRVMTGNNLYSEITRTAYRYEIEEPVEDTLLDDLIEVRKEITIRNEAAGRTIFNPAATEALQYHIDQLINGD